MLVWAATYVALLVIATVVVLARREPTVVRGDWVFLLTSLFVLLAAIVTAGRGGRFSLGVLTATVVVLLVGWVVQSRWWIIGASSGAVTTTIGECASRLCAPTASSPGEHSVTIPGGAIRMRVVSFGRSTMIVFVASSKHRKADLFRRLLAKQYRPVVPTIRLRQSSS